MALTPLYFITMDAAPIGPVEQVTLACRAGIRMVQLRMKDAPDAEFLRVAMQVKQICEGHGCLLVINDRAEIAATVGADGLHVGKEDLAVRDARRILGEGKIIGGTANTLEDIRAHFRNGADYVGLGPYRFTTTKKKLSPILGAEGFRRVLEGMASEHLAGKVYGIGGICAADVSALLDAGLFGVAFSGMLLQASDPAGLVTELETAIRKRKKNVDVC